MMHSSKSMSNQKNAQRSTGPKTKSGKAIVSKNAITHGATAKQFISNSENNAYQELIQSLDQTYGSDDPLIKMQIDRIAKIKVQLDRIQVLIDQSFDEASLTTTIDQHLMDILDLDESQRAKALDLAYDLETDAIDTDKLVAAQELLRNKALTFNTHAQLLSECPLFCQYLYDKAAFFNTTIDLYLQKEESLPGSKSNLETRIAMKLSKINRSGETDTLPNAISNITLERLLNVAIKFIDYPNAIQQADLKITMFKLLKNSNTFTGKPNFEDLNNLYRYQTTLQRQYSTALGELLILNKRSTELSHSL